MGIVTTLILFMVIIIIYVALIGFFDLMFRLTGLPKKKSFFQTISLLTAVGFTTTESEAITSNPVRRRLAISCMIIGNFLSLIIVSLIVDTVSSFNVEVLKKSWHILLIAFSIFVFILLFFNLPFIRKKIEKIIQKIGYAILEKKSGGNIITFLDNYGGESIAEIVLNKVPDLLKDTSLFDSEIKKQYSINVMAVKRNDAPVTLNKDTILQKHDTIIVFGNMKNINELFGRFGKDKKSKSELLKNNVENSVYILENYGDKAMAKVVVNVLPEILNDVTIYQSRIKELYGINVILLKREENLIDVTRDTKIQQGDMLTIFGPYKKIKALFGEVDTPMAV